MDNKIKGYTPIKPHEDGQIIRDLTSGANRYIQYNKKENMFHEIDREVALQTLKFNELKEAAQPLIKFLNKNYDPMTIAVVKEGRIDILRSEMGIPLKVKG